MVAASQQQIRPSMRPSILALPLVALASSASAQNLDALVAKHAAANGVPEQLVRRVIQIESRGRPHVVSAGNYGLMQIRLGTARAMGYSGTGRGLLDADTNMTYAVRYLAGAYRAAGGNADRAVRYYQRGYYYQAKAKGFSPYSTAAFAATQPVERPALAPTQPVAAPALAAAPPAPDRKAKTGSEPNSVLNFLANLGGQTAEPASKPRRAARASRNMQRTASR
jgi:soluble lytic murein transglycosylase-like protein